MIISNSRFPKVAGQVAGHPQNASPRQRPDCQLHLVEGPRRLPCRRHHRWGRHDAVSFTTQADTPSAGFTTVTTTVTGNAASKLFVRVNVTQE